MLHHRNKRKEKFWGLGELNKRQINKCALYIRNNFLLSHQIKNHTNDNHYFLKEYMYGIQGIDNYNECLERIRRQTDMSKCLQISDLNPIKNNDHRQLLLLYALVEHFLHGELGSINMDKGFRNYLISWMPTNDSLRDHFIASLDASFHDISVKKDIVRKLIYWENNIKLPKGKTKWLSYDKYQVDWAWELIIKNHNKPYYHSQILREPISTQDKRASILAKIDIIAMENTSEQIVTLNKLRNDWYQQKSRMSPNSKRQMSFTLRRESVDKINKLSDEWQCQKNEVIEKLLSHIPDAPQDVKKSDIV